MNEELIDKLRKNDPKAYAYVYRNCFPRKANFITQNSGSIEDAQDFFQQAVVIFSDKIRRDPDFTLTTFICNYLNSMTRLMWLDDLRKHKRKAGLDKLKIEELNEQASTEIDSITFSLNEEKNDLNQQRVEVLKTLDKECQEIIMAHYAYRMPWKEVAEEFNKTYGTIRVKGSACMKLYREKLKAAGLL